MEAPFFIIVDLYSSFRTTALRGLLTFVNTSLGPINTSSWQTTPSYKLTLFCTFTWLPSHTLDATKTFCPNTQF